MPISSLNISFVFLLALDDFSTEMRLVARHIDPKSKAGRVVLYPEEPEDMWHVYNLIAHGDHLKASTVRKVKEETATGTTSSSKVRTTLTLAVEGIEFDTAACTLRVKGRNIEENRFVKMGAYHTIDLVLNQNFTLVKDHWDFIAFDRLDLACDPSRTADVAAIVMEEGLAHICLVTSCMTITRSRIEVNIPRKRKGGTEQHDKGMEKFYETVMQGILRHIRFNVVKCVIIASPGFVKDQFFDFMYAEAIKSDIRVLIENKPKFLLVKSSTGHRHALKEVLANPAIAVKLADTKAIGEVKALDTFHLMLQNEPDRAYFGFDHVVRANEANAIETLMVTDELFRSKDVAKRKQYVKLVESVKENGGDIKIFSSLHVSGEQLGRLSGVAAILRFPLPEVETDSDSDSDEEHPVINGSK